MKYVLSLDGGIIPAVVLQEIKNRTGKNMHKLIIKTRRDT